ncbi:MAG: hypothetical protein NVSMB65_03970 [Chloroflexota bacterium]
MAHTADHLAAASHPGFTGKIVAPGDAEYDSARSVWNGAIDRKPALIMRCSSARDVAAAITAARDAPAGGPALSAWRRACRGDP